MKFGDVQVGDAAGAILVHSTRCGGRTLKKGLQLTADHVALLDEAGLPSVTVARLEPGDVHEDEAALLLADALAGEGIRVQRPFTGRANLFAMAKGVANLDIDAIDAVNMIDEAVTVATLPSFEHVDTEQMVATIKIIPFAVARDTLDRCLTAARASNGAIGVGAYRSRRIALIMTETGAIKDSVLDKTATVVANRLAILGLELASEERVAHKTRDLAQAVEQAACEHDLVLIYGASAITDRHDVIPAAIEQAGGMVDHLGMPVDPGNLLLLGHLGATTVLGLPGCARSPKLNGFDWVLQRVAAGLRVTGRDIMAMGVGGLLKEISLRPRPRTESEDTQDRADRAPRIGALVLAAGQSRRMGSDNKLLASIGGKPMVRHVVEALGHTAVESITVVTGHEAEAVTRILAGLDHKTVHNYSFADGLGTSLRCGISALPGDLDAVIVCLGDMPHLTPAVLDHLLAAYDPAENHAIIVPTHKGKRGNPVLWDRRFFEAMASISGDTGARHLIGENEDLVAEVEIDSDAVLIDIDTPEALAQTKQ
ncbi:MAG: molybdopterin-binding/glycosyltransferase family 2 protein [Alphaproteobacteria bacterium]|jgi:molybdenum cofactor cytidylyltransferase|nr:NTP transferase domain-containing protein [Rhodospirillaceae bacterium]MDG2480401.1 molybdopterin-binding/glycosyltransferase family 2 protein [Alphaproteobacteria bacterium]MBT6205694.1 NTP transferase domain-containing protein [Rhodospirillaceae bacterium]MBT6510076.1 NTP transferase domain-containing protein [Rhodospirillaceae bacterium]MBT7612294.1 NTP transferase domain-containing protein [Rhodospirillaceae bacterium]